MFFAHKLSYMILGELCLHYIPVLYLGSEYQLIGASKRLFLDYSGGHCQGVVIPSVVQTPNAYILNVFNIHMILYTGNDPVFFETKLFRKEGCTML